MLLSNSRLRSFVLRALCGFYSVNHQYPAHRQHTQLNIEGDLPIKNGLAEKVEGENCSLQDHTQGRGGAGALAGVGEADCGDWGGRGGVNRYAGIPSHRQRRGESHLNYYRN